MHIHTLIHTLIHIGKLALYTACAGVHPATTLPVHIDVGCDDDNIINDPMYMGLKQHRDRTAKYDDLVEEFIHACQDKYGSNILIQFEDFANSNAFRLLHKYQFKTCCFNDDIQGTAAVVLAGIIASYTLTKRKLSDHTFLFYGAGEAGVGVANLLATAIMKEDSSLSEKDARGKIWYINHARKSRVRTSVAVEFRHPSRTAKSAPSAGRSYEIAR